ncbi:MAG: ATP synthase subunit I [Xenococcaceae cyanobacterium]
MYGNGIGSDQPLFTADAAYLPPTIAPNAGDGHMILNLLSVAIAFVIGLGLGLFYFGGLWLTVRRLPTTKSPLRLMLTSFLLRLGISLVGFYLIIRGKLGVQGLAPLLVCVLGFLLIRTILIRRLQSQ